MKIEIHVVPPGGGKTSCTMFVELPAIPAQGDYVQLRERSDQGTDNAIAVRSYVVRRCWWFLESVDYKGKSKLADIALEVEKVEIREFRMEDRTKDEFAGLYEEPLELYKIKKPRYDGGDSYG